MKEIIKNKLDAIETKETKLHVLRESLQVMILKVIEDKRYLQNIAFVGGTALRILYDLKRYSEDLDFSLIHKDNFHLEQLVIDLKQSFHAWNMEIEVQEKNVQTVQKLLIKIPDIMYETGISPLKSQKMMIKLEIDTNPPIGFRTEVRFVNKDLPLNVCHFDLPSLFAGKLHAVLQRVYTKGRDYYDLMWYLSKKISPNMKLLENSLHQTTGQQQTMTLEYLKQELLSRIERVDFNAIRDELLRFVEDKSELTYVVPNTFIQLINEMKM